jgi:hypothetical protein
MAALVFFTSCYNEGNNAINPEWSNMDGTWLFKGEPLTESAPGEKNGDHILTIRSNPITDQLEFDGVNFDGTFSEITFIGSYTLDNPNLGNPNYNSNLYVKLENRNRLSGYILSRKGGSTIKKTFTATRIE